MNRMATTMLTEFLKAHEAEIFSENELGDEGGWKKGDFRKLRIVFFEVVGRWPEKGEQKK